LGARDVLLGLRIFASFFRANQCSFWCPPLRILCVFVLALQSGDCAFILGGYQKKKPTQHAYCLYTSVNGRDRRKTHKKERKKESVYDYYSSVSDCPSIKKSRNARPAHRHNIIHIKKPTPTPQARRKTQILLTTEVSLKTRLHHHTTMASKFPKSGSSNPSPKSFRRMGSLGERARNFFSKYKKKNTSSSGHDSIEEETDPQHHHKHHHDNDVEEVVIVGAGIVGLVLALSLHTHAGITPKVYEQAQDFHDDVGAGMGMYPNGLRVIRDISPDLLKDVQEAGYPYLYRRWEVRICFAKD
jgi:hypothetical protein